MWPRKYSWLNFVILECSLNVWIVNKIVFAAPELCESALPNPKFLLHCRKWRNINLSWRKFQTSISSTLRKNVESKLTNVISGTYRTFWHIFRVYSTAFLKAGLVPLIERIFGNQIIPWNRVRSAHIFLKIAFDQLPAPPTPPASGGPVTMSVQQRYLSENQTYE